MITGKPAPDPFESAAAPIMHLARKYDCAQIATFTIAVLYQVLEDSVYMFALIKFAAIFDIPDLLARSLRQLGEGMFAREELGPHNAGLHGMRGRSFDPSAWALSNWKTMPIEYIWALTRARCLEGELSEQADLFLLLMKKIKGEFRVDGLCIIAGPY